MHKGFRRLGIPAPAAIRSSMTRQQMQFQTGVGLGSLVMCLIPEANVVREQWSLLGLVLNSNTVLLYIMANYGITVLKLYHNTSCTEKARQKQLLDDAKYLGETSLWDVLKDEETEETYYFNKLTQKTQWEKPKCFIKQEEEKAEELRKIKAENERKRQKRANARGGFKDRKKRLQKGRAKIKQREEEEKQDRLEANAMAMER
eukprot:g14492.t1